MGLRIGTNVAALTANRNLQRVGERLSANFNHLATGSRIARASDDAAGVAVSARLRARIRSLDQAARNAQDGISLLRVAEGGLGEIEGSLIRMRELAVQAANGTLSSTDINLLQTEFAQLGDGIGALSNSVKFNGVALLNNSTTTYTFQVGADTTAASNHVTVDMVNVGEASLAISTLDISSDASAAITALDTALNTVTSNRATFGAFSNRLEATFSQLQTRSENMAAANSRLQDVDVASETADLTKNSILQQAAIAVLAQANLGPQAALTLLG